MSTTVYVNSQNRADTGTQPGNWSETHAPAANTQATCTHAAPGTGLQHVLQTINARLVAGASAPTAAAVQVNVLSGAVIKMSFAMGVEAVAGSHDDVTLHDLNLEIDEDSDVTLEFTTAGGDNTIESVAMTGYTQNVAPTPPLG